MMLFMPLIERGIATSSPRNLAYRMPKLRSKLVPFGLWLDCGCAEGGYTAAIIANGARKLIGIDIEIDRLHVAHRMSSDISTIFTGWKSEFLPFVENIFEGVFMNEVLEHVSDEQRTLHEVFRVLRPGGHLVLMSPNRWFPFDGHGMIIGNVIINLPTPILPWIPYGFAKHFMRARNYWPGQLRKMISEAGFTVISSEAVLPVFEVYRWLPDSRD